MNETCAEPARTTRWKSRKRLSMLLGSMVALLVVHIAVGLGLGFPGSGAGSGLPLDRCLTEQAVLAFLDGKSVVSLPSNYGAGIPVDMITLRKEKISSLKMRSDEYYSILVQFNLDHEGKQYTVEGSFELTTSDDPELHYHGWHQFMRRVVSSH
jgi:hypothetical protein